jgi:hypothetical protein
MSIEGSQLANAMMSIHEAELEQASRYPGSDLSDRVQRSVVLHRRERSAVRGFGGMLARLRHLLKLRDMQQPVPLERKPAQTA